MSNYHRNRVPGGTYFFTVNLNDRRDTLLVDHIGTLQAAFREVWRARPFKQHAIVVLPEHIHCIWQLPEGNSEYAMRWSHIKSAFSRRLPTNELRTMSRYAKRERGIWQRRYWEHQIRDEVDYLAHVDYIHNNPVKHGYVTDTADWPYCRVGLGPPLWW